MFTIICSLYLYSPFSRDDVTLIVIVFGPCILHKIQEIMLLLLTSHNEQN